MLDLRLSVANLLDAFFVRTFVFAKFILCLVQSIKYTLWFLVLFFAHSMWMSHWYFDFSTFSILYDRSVFAGRKYAWICWTRDWVLQICWIHFVLFRTFVFAKFILCLVQSINTLYDFWFCSVTLLMLCILILSFCLMIKYQLLREVLCL